MGPRQRSRCIGYFRHASGLAALLFFASAASAQNVMIGDFMNGFTGGSPAQITVTVFPTSSSTVTVQYATSNGPSPNGAVAGTDYTPNSGTLIFAPGQSSQTVSVTSLTKSATTLYFTFTLSNATNATLFPNPMSVEVGVTGSGYSPPQPSVEFSSANYTVSENVSAATINVVLSSASLFTVQVPYSTSNGTAVAGTDYTATSGTLTFMPGFTSQSFTVPIKDRHITHGSKTVSLALGTPTGATLGSPGTATLTILDNDPPPTHVTVQGIGGQFSPDPAPIDTWVEASLTAQATRPTPPSPAILSSPTWDWRLSKWNPLGIQFSTESATGPWSDGSNMGVWYLIASAPAPGPDAIYDYSAITLSASFPTAAYWQVACKPRVTYTDTAGGTYAGAGTAVAQGTTITVTIKRRIDGDKNFLEIAQANNNTDVLIGQLVALEAEITPKAKGTYQWSMPDGSPFRRYVMGAGAATLFPLEDRNLDDRFLDFHYAEPAPDTTGEVTCAFTPPGSISAVKNPSTKLNVKGPVVKSYTTLIGKPAVFIDKSNGGRHFGLVSDDGKGKHLPGIIFRAELESLKAVWGDEGNWCFQQTIKPNWKYKGPGGEMFHWWCNGKIVYDTTKKPESPYAPNNRDGFWLTGSGSHATSDTPSSPCIEQIYPYMSAQNYFRMYIMFRPPGKSSQWVPVKVARWFFAGIATWSAEVEQWGVADAKQDSVVRTTYVHPHWSENFWSAPNGKRILPGWE